MNTREEAQRIYEYESGRIKSYEDRFMELIKGSDNEHELLNLFMWYGNARAIKSKAYQEKKQEVLWARQCSITGEGMNEGWCWGDGEFYTKYEKDTLAECVKDKLSIIEHYCLTPDEVILENISKEEFDNINSLMNKDALTPSNLLTMGYVSDYLYWTEWEVKYDAQYKEINGKLIEL